MRFSCISWIRKRSETKYFRPFRMRSHPVLYKGEALCFTQDEAQIQIQLPENLEKEADTIIRIRLKECVREKEQMEIHFTGKE